MANKETFADSLNMIPEALKWAERQDIKQLRDFFIEDAQKPLYCFASGGSYSAVDYAALLYEANKGMAGENGACPPTRSGLIHPLLS